MNINIRGPIISDSEQQIYDYFNIPATSPGVINKQLETAKKTRSTKVNVLINSGGGSVFSASEIYTALKSFSGEVVVQIVGVAASAASVIAMAGSHVEMSPTAQLMIHNASVSVHGDYREMDHTSEFLKNINKSIMNAYTAKTGLNEAKLKSMMDKTTWMNAHQALELRFIDSVMFENEQSATASINIPHLVNGVLPPEVIEKMRNQLSNKRSFTASNTTEDSKSTERQLIMAHENMLKDKPVINSLPKNNPPSYSREEGEYAINVMKTMKNLNTKGINTNDLTTNEVLEVQGLIEAFVIKS
ncbi:Clp protease ClpP [Lysinibacillus agricola]|uniref:ATP-dependent Clp protease proteolytic subunit n=1 Tax=Lysinibacillus agricola TaxID=2590012 RepID=A0ABX7AN33_9BACI|nr:MULTISPECIES: head maturation protease, ClpP-related [Lysinibacillus]QQP11355.1 Clp protease ClpP [Lysinibacillus agricola]